MEILTLENELLRQKAQPVKSLKNKPESLQETVQLLLEKAKKGKGIGLAGPQIGISERIFVVNIEKDVPKVFINPAIIETSLETVKYEEGCLSIPGIWADVIRPKTVKVQAWNEKGRPFTVEADGLYARVILHEYDHLEGVLFIDRLPEQKRNKIIAKIAKRAKK
ncbi:MAG: peptide deformylase [Treponema sp.]|nr:peptide deformylase [Treponema sp.]